MEKSLYKTYEEVESTHWWFCGRRKIILDIFDRYSVSKKHIKILDFGCNTGFFVGYLQKDGFDAYGIDMSEDSIEFGMKRGVKNLLVGKTPLPYTNESFDIILALDVIEHIEHQDEAIKDLYRLLKPGGKAIIMVPAFMFMWGLQDEVAHHFRRYTKPTLKDVVLRNGFKIERISYFNFFMFVPIVMVRLLQRVILPKRSSDFDINNKFINYILTKAFVFESLLLKYINYPFGVSLVATISKHD